jgi:hypothetical protein
MVDDTKEAKACMLGSSIEAGYQYAPNQHCTQSHENQHSKPAQAKRAKEKQEYKRAL